VENCRLALRIFWKLLSGSLRGFGYRTCRITAPAPIPGPPNSNSMNNAGILHGSRGRYRRGQLVKNRLLMNWAYSRIEVVNRAPFETLLLDHGPLGNNPSWTKSRHTARAAADSCREQAFSPITILHHRWCKRSQREGLQFTPENCPHDFVEQGERTGIENNDARACPCWCFRLSGLSYSTVLEHRLSVRRERTVAMPTLRIERDSHPNASGNRD